jgi:two-component system OmpR family sensor kinase
MEPGAKTGSDDFLADQPPKPPGRHRLRWGSLRKLSERTPLRIKLITLLGALVAIALSVIGFVTVAVFSGYLQDQADTQLQTLYQSVKTQVPGQPPLPGSGHANYGFLPQNDVVEFVTTDGQVIQLTRQATVLPLPAVPTSTAWLTANAGQPTTVPAVSGSYSWRVIVQRASLRDDAGDTVPGVLVVGVSLLDIDHTITYLTRLDIIVSAAILAVVIIVGIALVRANLRPLDDIELTAGQIAAGHLDHRIPERDPRTEVGSLGRSLNTMLSQIETAFHAREESEQAAHRSEERMRRFIADASHELRTPLTTIRGFAEYYRQRGGAKKIKGIAGATDSAASGMTTDTAQSPGGLTPEELDRIMKRLESEASRMGLLVEDLLQLARLDQQRPLDKRPVDLLTLAADAVQDARLVAPDRRIDLDVATSAAFLVDGDEQRLRQVIGNLVNNALTHTPAGTSVRVAIASGTLKSGNPAVVLDVIDDGRGMTAEQAQRVFERFYRADAARNRASGGTGLGLAIVAGLVNAHGGQVSVKTAPGQGADFRVKLPLSPDALPTEDQFADDLASDDLPSDDQAGPRH